MVRVKICGITRAVDVDAAVSAGADAVGFIVGFPSSPRNLALSEAAELMAHVPPMVTRVLVAPATLVARYHEDVLQLRPGAVQLYGDSPSIEGLRRLVPTQFIRVQTITEGGIEPAKVKEGASGFDALLTDTYRQGYAGGTGVASDWSACASIRGEIEPLPLILSGGLNPSNVAQAIRVVRPYAVDASSGVESSPGVKDKSKLREFARKAKEVDIELEQKVK